MTDESDIWISLRPESDETTPVMTSNTPNSDDLLNNVNASVADDATGSATEQSNQDATPSTSFGKLTEIFCFLFYGSQKHCNVRLISGLDEESVSSNAPVFVIEQFSDAGGDLSSHYTSITELGSDCNYHTPFQVRSSVVRYTNLTLLCMA